uniref:Uncharacterized protein n=1 Tax=Parascaris equorum TaxID=6256 RepID=A0A914RBU3_PAREQ
MNERINQSKTQPHEECNNDNWLSVSKSGNAHNVAYAELARKQTNKKTMPVSMVPCGEVQSDHVGKLSLLMSCEQR